MQHEDRISGGLADKKKPKDFDPVQLKTGIKVEMEHTSDRAIAQEIAMDHLTEDPDYYKKLKTIEKAKKAPLFSIRKRKDGSYKKMRDGEWKRLPKEKDPIKDWALRLRQTRSLSQNDRDAWVAEQFRKANKPVGHILYACRQILHDVGLERQSGFKGFCQAIIEKCYEHGPAGVEKDSVEIWDKAFKSVLERRPEKNVPLDTAESMAHSKPFFRDNLKWYRYCIRRMARKNEGLVNMLDVERYMKNAMNKHKTPPPVDYDE
jgi:hypothetical protein